jgi:hypothetical protein
MKKLLIMSLLCTAGLLSAKENAFTQYKDKVKSLKTIYVATDITVVEDMVKDTVGINLPYNQKVAKEMFANIKQLFANTLDAEFVQVTGSVGMYQPDNVYIPDYSDIDNHIVLPVLNAEIEFARKQEFIAQIDPLIDRSFANTSTKNKKAMKKYRLKMLDKDFSRIGRLGLADDEAVLMVITTGIKVPTGKSVKQAVVTGLLTLGFYSGWQNSATQLNTILISNDGTLLWAGATFKAGKPSKDRKQESLLKKIYKGFPVKLVSVTKKR